MTDNPSPTLSVAAAELKIFDEFPLPYIELDASGYITRANRATRQLDSADQGSLIGRMVWDSMPTDEKEKNCAAYFSLMESGEDPPVVLRNIYDHSGQFRTYEIHRSLLFNDEGRPSGMRLVCVDVTETQKNLEEARNARLWLESVIASMVDAVVVSDALGFICSANPAAEMLLGWASSQLIGKQIEAVLPILSFDSSSRTELCTPMALSRPCRGIATMIDSNEKKLRVEVGTSPIVSKKNGVTEGVVMVLRRLGEAA
jgi:PAS domain S-box-containing protein